MTVNYQTYTNEKKAFFEKHNYDFKTDTSSMDEYGRYTKTYMFEDGATWIEHMSPEWVKADVEIKMAKVQVEIKMFRTEYYNTADAESRYYYEKF